MAWQKKSNAIFVKIKIINSKAKKCGEVDFLDAEKVGNAIAYLRKKIGYTQKELADRLGVCDQAVSRWERGVGLPDIAIIGKIAILLDSDTDSILAGDIIHHNNEWTGLLILKKNPYGIKCSTIIYDKPIGHYLISYFMLMGIQEIRVVCSTEEMTYFNKEFGNGEKFGLNMTYFHTLPWKEYEKNDSNVMVVSDLTFIYGVDQTRFFQKAMYDRKKTTVLSLPKKKVGESTQIYYDSDKKIVTSEDGEKLRTQYDYYQIPIMFCPAEVICNTSFRKQITEETSAYIKISNDVYTVILDRGFVEIPLNNWEDIADAAMFVKTVQKACGMQIYCIEEIAWRRGLISHEDFYKLGKESNMTPKGKYILEIANARVKK